MGATSCSMHRTVRFHTSDPFRAIIATPFWHTARTAAQPYIARTTHVHVCMHSGGRGGGRDQKRGSDNPAEKRATQGDTHTLVSALRIHTPHSIEILATDGTTVNPDDAHTPLSCPPFVTRATQGAHTHTLAPALRIRTPHSVEILAADGATIDPDDANTPLSRPPWVFVHHILSKSTMAPPSTLTMHTHHSVVRLAYSYTTLCRNPHKKRARPPKLGS